MRAAVFLVVLAFHVGLFFLFAVLRSPKPLHHDDEQAFSLAFLLPLQAEKAPIENTASAPTTVRAGAASGRKRAQTAVAASAPPQPPAPSEAITTPEVAPDWRHELQIAANNALEGEERKRRHPQCLRRTTSQE
jgi:hypothetical protein